MAKHLRNYNYKDKNVIISLFNESQSHYKKYKDLLDGNSIEAQKELNTAGNKIQQSYELGLKCYLNRKYKELYDSGNIRWQEYSCLTSIIEKGRQLSGAMVDVKYLVSQMSIYAVPRMQDTDIDFELIKRNTKPIYNDNKHIGNAVNVNYFEESYAEIRKFILTYIDANPPINIIQSSEYMNLQEACDFWGDTTKYNYCLICGKTNLDDSARKRLIYINWSLIIDFDEETQNDGLYKSYVTEYGVQPNSFDVINPRNTIFNNATKKPYWFFANGLSGVSESLVDTDRRWNQKYGAIVNDILCNYREAFSKPLKVVILNGPAKRVDRILTALDAIYEDALRLYLLSTEVQFEGIKEDYKAILDMFPLSEYEFSQGINNFASLFHRNSTHQGFQVCGREGKVDINLEDFSCFEIPFLGIADVEETEDAKRSEIFYQGGRNLSWYGAQNGFAINRITQYRKYRRDIQNACNETTSKIIRLYHDPGAGGTTLSRCLAYDFSKEMPVLVLTSYNERITPTQAINFYKKVGMSVLIVVESSVISDDELQRFNGELMANAIPHVFLYVSRIKKKYDSSDDALRYLKDDEFKEMYEKLEPYLQEKRKTEVLKLLQHPKERYPFFMSMYTFDEDFKGVDQYINHFIIDSSSDDRTKLEYISLVDWFANRSLDISFLNTYTSENEIFDNAANDNLVVFDNKGHNTYVKMRHPRFAESIIERRIHGDGNLLVKADNLSRLLREFIRYSKMNIMYDLDSTIDVLKNLLILRDTESMVKSRFAPVIEYIKDLIPENVDDNAKYNCIGLVFKELVEVYPDEPHFRAHLSRYYSHIEKNYEKGIGEARKAVNMAEQQGEHDSLLYHIYGMSIRKFVEQKLYEEAKECKRFNESKLLEEKLIEIKNYLSLASEQFEKVRSTNNKIAGYVSDIEMCIAVVDFGKELYNKSTEAFVAQYKESWMMTYYDRALTLLEGFRTIQVEEDTEFYKVRLQTRCVDSLQDMIYGIEATVDMWKSYLDKAEEMQKPVVRRFIARAKEKECLQNNNINKEEIKEILNLMEQNIIQEPNNGANIRIWFNALRKLDDENADILLDDALQKLATWKQIGDNLEAYYYYFVLMCIKAIEGSSRAEAVIPELQEELKTKTAHMPNNRVIYEWLGAGKGINRLMNSYEQVDGKYHKKSLEVIEKEAYYLEGRITKYKSDRSAQIRAYNMEVFFSPSGQNSQSTPEDVNKKVKFILGFSYDGLRALNRSVQIINSTQEESVEEGLIGKHVRCSVIGPDNAGNYLKVKLLDYRNIFGSIHSSELPDGKNVYDYENQDVFYAEVIGEKFVERESKNYYQLTLREQELSEWQKKLLEATKEKM